MHKLQQETLSRHAVVWQRVLLAFCALGVVALAISVASGTIMSDSARGFQLSPGPANSLSAVVSYVAPNGRRREAVFAPVTS